VGWFVHFLRCNGIYHYNNSKGYERELSAGMFMVQSDEEGL
jgi:hypothetical protein